MQQSTEAYDLLQRDDNVDKVNMYMKDDLHYEKERNKKVSV
jgi:type IV secretory pathway TrbF-like protein